MSLTTTLWSSTYVDHVFTYTGYNYEIREAANTHLTLYGINELARKNRLILCRRQISNRDVRILIENNPQLTTKSINENQIINNKNYEKFLFNFNRLAIACYLTALQSNDQLWSLYNIPLQLAKDTNFYVIESSPTINERHMRKILSDNEFLTNYLETIYNLHMNVSNCLNKNLNTNLPKNNSFNNLNDDDDNNKNDNFLNNPTSSSSSSTNGSNDIHLFRSFRLLGLRHRINNKDPSNIKLDPFNEIIEIRCAYDIKQFNNKTSYDCFIECEISYFKIMPDNFTLNDHKWFNYLNNFNDRNLNNNNNNNKSKNLGTIDEQLEINIEKNPFYNSRKNRNY